MIVPYLFFAEVKGKGRGMFTSENIPENTIIEVSPVIVMNDKDRKLLDETLLHDYIFIWGDHGECCMALGYVALYNHSYQSNCEYEMDYEQKIITIKTVRFVRAGEELHINYNGDWNSRKRVWFDVLER